MRLPRCLMAVLFLAAATAWAGEGGAPAPRSSAPEGPLAGESAPSSPAERRRAAESLAAGSRDAQREGNLFLARNRAEAALELFPEEAGYHFLLGGILFRQNDLYYAHKVMERGLDLEPENSGARLLLGDIYYREGFLDLALEQWGKVPNDSPHGGRLRKKMEKAERERGVEEDFGREVSRNFTLLYDGPVPRVVVLSLLTQLERAYRLLERELASAPPGDILVILYSRIDFHRITAWPSWAGGIYDGKIRIPVKGLAVEHDAARLDPILRHELTHAFLQSMVGRRLPLWFEEGLAEYFERKSWEREEPPPRSRDSFSSLEEISRALRGKGETIEEAYSAAAAAVLTLVEEKGFTVIPALLDAMSAGVGFHEALRDEADLTVEGLHRLWKSGGS